MRKYILTSTIWAITIVGLFASLSITSSAQAFSGTGEGVALSPYEISTCEQLQEMTDDLAGTYILTNDIDCSETSDWPDGFVPVSGAVLFENAFTGTFDGQGYVISGLYSNAGDSSAGGIFGMIAFNAVVKDFALEDCQLYGGPYTGALAGIAFGAVTISDVTTDCTVAGYNTIPFSEPTVVGVGGLVGAIAGQDGGQATITRSHTSGVVAASFTEEAGVNMVGGLVGYMFDGSILTDSYSTASVVSAAEGTMYIGGAVGGSRPIVVGPLPVIKNVYSIGTVTAEDGNAVGGLIGLVGATDMQYNFTASPIITNGSVTKGGLVGFAAWDGSGMVWDYNYVDVSSAGAEKCIGSFFLAYNHCTQVNTDEAPNTEYFLGNKVSAPLSSWDFDTIWQVQAGGYPILNYREATPPIDNGSSGGNSSGGDNHGDDTPRDTGADLKKAKKAILSGEPSTPVTSSLTGIFLNDYDDYVDGSGHRLAGLTVGQVIHFEITVNGMVEQHTMTIKEIGSDYITVTIASTPFDLRLPLSQETDVIIDDQKVMTAQVVSINGSFADITLAKVMGVGENTSPEVTQDTSSTGQPSVNGRAILLVGVLVLLTIGAVYLKIRRT